MWIALLTVALVSLAAAKPPSRAGQCPTRIPLYPCTPENSGDECKRDNRCPKGQKCCDWTCGKKCVAPECAPVLCEIACKFGFKKVDGCEVCECNPSPCEGYKCGPGQICELQEVQCFTTPCYPLPTCVDEPLVCPELEPGTYGVCVEACTNNEDCSAGQLCCSNGCGHTCQTGVSPAPNPCQWGSPEVDPVTGEEKFCGRGTNRQDCSAGFECLIDELDRYAVCCPLSTMREFIHR